MAAGLLPALAAAESQPRKTADLFQLDTVWTVHLQFTADQWKAMQPNEPEGFGPGPGGPGRPGEPGRRGGGGFGPGMFLAPAWMQQGDTSQDGQLTAEEFRRLGEKWFQAWDKDRKGTLTEDAIRDGLNASLAGPPGGPGGPGGMRGPGGPGGPESFLQGRNGGRNGLSAARGIEFPYVHADLTFAGQSLSNVAVRYKGNGTFMQSRGDLKRSFKIDLNKHQKGQKLAGVTTLNLHNNVTDAGFMNEPLAHRLYRDAGVPAPRSSYARVHLSVPGLHTNTYAGLYSVVENPDERFAEEHYGTKKGLILKPVTQRLFEYQGDDWGRYQQAYDPKTDPTAAQKARFLALCKLVSEATDEEFAARIGDLVDLDEVSRYLAVTVWIATLDSILGVGQNFLAYLNPKTDKFELWPWDLDHSFGQFGMVGAQEERENLSIREPWTRDVLFLQRLMKVPRFSELYLGAMKKYQASIFQPARLKAQVDEVAQVIRPAVADEDPGKLERFDKVVAGEPVPPAGMFGGGGRRGPGGPDGPGGPGGFPGMPRMVPPKPIKGFVEARHQSVERQLSDPGAGQRIQPGMFGGGPRGPGGRGGPNMGPGMFLARPFVTAMDQDKDGTVTRAEFDQGFQRWFAKWDTEKAGRLGLDALREGMNSDLAMFPGGPPPGGPEGGPVVRPFPGPGN